MDAIVAVADPTGAGPDIPVHIAADAVGTSLAFGCRELALVHGKGFPFAEFHTVGHLINTDLLRRTCVHDVELLVVGREAQAVRFFELVSHLLDFARGINAVDGFLEEEFPLVALVVHHAAVARIGEPNATVWMHHRVVGRVEGLAVEGLRQRRDPAVEFVPDHAAVGVFAGDLAALPVEGVAIAVAGVVSHHADVTVLGQVAHLSVVRDVAPDEVVSSAIPSRALSPEHAGVQAANGRVSLNVLLKRRFQGDHVGIRIALGDLSGPIAGDGGGGGSGGKGGEEGTTGNGGHAMRCSVSSAAGQEISGGRAETFLRSQMIRLVRVHFETLKPFMGEVPLTSNVDDGRDEDGDERPRRSQGHVFLSVPNVAL